MNKKRVLIIASYPIVNPKHGGQKRLEAIVRYYENIFLDVKFIGVYHRTAYNDHGPEDVLVGDNRIISEIENQPIAIDLITGESIDRDIHVRSPIAKVLIEYKPDIIHIEQPYCYVGLKVLIKELGVSARIIYGSQNIEYKMKEQIYSGLNVDNNTKTQLVNKIKYLENELSKDADLVIAVSDNDAEEHKRMGAKNVVVIKNGIERKNVKQKSVQFWKQYKSKHAIKNIIIYVGSGHPPNWMGLLKMIGTDLRFLPEGSRILLAGGVSQYFEGGYNFKSRKERAGFFDKAIMLGQIDDDKLAGLIDQCELIILPITSGGGSNLKTAEAIVADKKIVSTDYAFRSYEAYQNLPNIFLSKNNTDFKKNIIVALKSTKVVRSDSEKDFVSRLYWDSCLEPLGKELLRIKQPSRANLKLRGYFSKFANKFTAN